jgi:hypothetical protein
MIGSGIVVEPKRPNAALDHRRDNEMSNSCCFGRRLCAQASASEQLITSARDRRSYRPDPRGIAIIKPVGARWFLENDADGAELHRGMTANPSVRDGP